MNEVKSTPDTVTIPDKADNITLATVSPDEADVIMSGTMMADQADTIKPATTIPVENDGKEW